MFADCQRALKWLIYNGSKYGYDTSSIALLGFSAGGNLVSTTYHLLMNEDILPADYTWDEIDHTKISLGSLAMVYPKLLFTNDSKLLTMTVGLDVMQNETTTNEAIAKYTLSTKVKKDQVPTFLVNATDDGLISSEDILKYALELQKNQVPFEMHNYGRGNHGFGACVKQDPNWVKDTEGVETWLGLYAIWLKKSNLY